MNDISAENEATGCIDEFGYHNAAGGWLFVGWVRKAFMEAGEWLYVTAQFFDGIVGSQAVVAFYERPDVQPFGVGFVAFVLHDEALYSKLESFVLDWGVAAYGIPVSPRVTYLYSERIDLFFREFLAEAKLIGKSTPIASLVQCLSSAQEEEEQFTRPPDREMVQPEFHSVSTRALQIVDEFDEAAYLGEHPEVAEAIAAGHLPNALFHYRLFGAGAWVRNAPGQQPPTPRALPLQSTAVAPVSATHASFGSCAVDVVMSVRRQSF